jgi:hypothetical protein
MARSIAFLGILDILFAGVSGAFSSIQTPSGAERGPAPVITTARTFSSFAISERDAVKVAIREVVEGIVDIRPVQLIVAV